MTNSNCANCKLEDSCDKILSDCEDVSFSEEAIKELKDWVTLLSGTSEEIGLLFDSKLKEVTTKISDDTGETSKLTEVLVSFKVKIGEEMNWIESDYRLSHKDGFWNFLLKYFSDSEGRTLRNYMKIAKSEIDEKYYSLGIDHILTILTAIGKKNFHVNDFLANGLKESDFELRKHDRDEWKRHLIKRSKLFADKKSLESELINLTEEENKSLIDAVDNNYTLTKKDIEEFKKIKMNNGSIVKILNNKIIKTPKQAGNNTLTLQTKIANFRELFSDFLHSIEFEDKNSYKDVDRKLIDDMVGKIEKLESIFKNIPQDEQDKDTSSENK